MAEMVTSPAVRGLFWLFSHTGQRRWAKWPSRPAGPTTIVGRRPRPGVTAATQSRGPASPAGGSTPARCPAPAANRVVAESPTVARWCYPTLQVRSDAFAAALEHARSSAECEVIGLLVRPTDSPDRLATAYIPIDEAECSATAAKVAGDLHKRLGESLNSAGQVVVGFVHSHPSGSRCLHSRVDETFVREFLPSFAEHGRIHHDRAGRFRLSASAVEYQLSDGRWRRYRLVGPPVAGDPEAREPRRWVAPDPPTFDVAATRRAPLVTDEGERLQLRAFGTSLSFGIPHDTTLVREEYEEEPAGSVLFSLIVTPAGDAAAGALLLLPDPAGREQGLALQLFGPAPLQVVVAQPEISAGRSAEPATSSCPPEQLFEVA